MAINKDLLEKFASGNCTDEERQLVEEWMNNNHDIPELPLSETEKELAQKRIWNNIAEKVTACRKDTMRYTLSAAAAIVLLLSGMTLLWHREDERYMELGGKNKVAEVEGMRFTLAGNSQAKMKFTSGEAANIVFCGLMEVTNTSGKDRPYVFESSCEKSNYTKKSMLMKAGKTYIVLHNYYKKDEIIILNRDNLAGLPDAITAQISEQFRI